MSNLTRPPTPSSVPVPHAAAERGPTDLLARALLDDLRASRRDAPPLEALSPVDYARTHAAFELLSDQRRLITEHLAGRLAGRTGAAVSVLSVGCGDGTLDAPLAASLTDAQLGRPVRYVGVDPYAGSTRAFEAALDGLARDTLAVEVHTTTFDALVVAGPFDVIMFVHSTYYVRDVAETLAAAYALLGAGGELLVLSAPRAELNALVDVLAPPLDGHEQWFSDDLEDGLRRADIAYDKLTLAAGLDAAAASDEVLDFTVQARLTPELRPLVRAYLEAVATSAGAEAGRRVPHPVDVYRVVRVDRS